MRKIYIVSQFMLKGQVLGTTSYVAEVRGPITIEIVRTWEKLIEESRGAIPGSVVILDWEELEG